MIENIAVLFAVGEAAISICISFLNDFFPEEISTYVIKKNTRFGRNKKNQMEKEKVSSGGFSSYTHPNKHSRPTRDMCPNFELYIN